MKLTFIKAEVEKLIEITRSAKSHLVPYTGSGWGTPKDTTPGLMLVGDQGVYLMSNADGQAKTLDDSFPVAYAEECNPYKLHAEVVYKNKVNTFGGDDGAEFLPLVDVEKWLASSDKSRTLNLDLSPDSFSLLSS